MWPSTIPEEIFAEICKELDLLAAFDDSKLKTEDQFEITTG